MSSKKKNINILEVDEHLDEISSTLCDVINENLVEYGLLMPEFFVTNIVTPDDDPNFRRLKQQHADMYLKVREEQVLKAEAEASAERQAVEAATAARMKVIGAQGEAEAYKLKAEAEAAEMRMKGYTYQQETARQVGLAAMENIGSGGAGSGIGDIAGLGVTLGAMGGVLGMTREALNPVAAMHQEQVKLSVRLSILRRQAGIASAVTRTYRPSSVPIAESHSLQRLTPGIAANVQQRTLPQNSVRTADQSVQNSQAAGLVLTVERNRHNL